MKGQASGDKISTFDFHSFNYLNKTILLFDDVYTSGTTFKQMANKLINTGANDVIGIFLAKTISDNDLLQSRLVDMRSRIKSSISNRNIPGPPIEDDLPF